MKQQSYRVDVIDSQNYVPVTANVLAGSELEAAAKVLSFDFDKSPRAGSAPYAGEVRDLRIVVRTMLGPQVSEHRLSMVIVEQKPLPGRFAHPDDYGKAVKQWKEKVLAQLDAW